jgi:hypothetical protein
VEQHAETQKEQSDIVQKDKTSVKGLFKGIFGRPRVPGRSMSSEDQCPMCLMELDHTMGRCPQCGMRPVDYFDSYEDEDYAEEDDFSYPSFSEPGSINADRELTTDPDFDDIEDDFDGIAATHYLDYVDDDMEFEDESTLSGLSTWANASAVHRYVQDTYYLGRRSASHSASASRRHSSSVISDYAEAEMAVLEEEDEEDMDDGDSSMSGMTEDEDATTGAEDSEQTMHSARSTPSSGTGASSASSTSRRRPRADSNTPTPSMGQPSQRRRLSPPRQSTPYYAMESEDSWVDEPEGEEDSDEEGTTIGCEPTNSNGARGGSLTMASDQNQGRPRSRANTARVVRSAPLRNRGSAIQINASTYDDDADDDAEGSSMQTSLRRQAAVDHDSDEGGVELESPEQPMPIPRRSTVSRPVNERIRQAFSNHTAGAEDYQMGMPNLDALRELNRTPLARPRPASRNGGMVILNQSRHEGPRLHFNINTNGGPGLVGSSMNFPFGESEVRPPSSNSRRTPLGHQAFGGPSVPPPRTTYGSSTNNPYWNTGNGTARPLRNAGSNTTLRGSTSSHRLRPVGSRNSVRSPQSSPNQPRRVLNNPPEHPQPRPLTHTPSRMHLLPGSNAASRGLSYGMVPETSVPLGPFAPTRESISRNGDRFVDAEARIRQRMREPSELQHLNQRRTNHYQQSQGGQLPRASNLDSPGISIARPSANPFASRTLPGSGFSMPPPPPSVHHHSVGIGASGLNNGGTGSNSGLAHQLSAIHGPYSPAGPGRRRSHQRLSAGNQPSNATPSLNQQTAANSPRRGQNGRGGSHMVNGRGA